MKTLLLIDGSNLLFQMFYGMPARITNSRGKPIQGTIGFLGALRKIIHRTAPTHIAVIFDGEHHNPRRDLDPNYKANRPDYSELAPEETPFSQLPDIYAALNHLGIKHAETITCEADDILAAYALTAPADMRVVLASQDSDLFQLISDQVSILRYRGDNTTVWGANEFREKFGIAPSQYVEYKALVGDPSDNISGIPRIGPKTASALLRDFCSLEQILANIDRITPKSIRTSLEENKTLLYRNIELIRLRANQAPPFPHEALTYGDSEWSSHNLLLTLGIK